MKRLDSLLQAPASTLECRGMGHSWDFHHDSDLLFAAGKLVELQRWEQCHRCGTQRVRTINLQWLLVRGTKMVYGDDYLMARGAHAVRSEALAELYRRALLDL